MSKSTYSFPKSFLAHSDIIARHLNKISEDLFGLKVLYVKYNGVNYPVNTRTLLYRTYTDIDVLTLNELTLQQKSCIDSVSKLLNYWLLIEGNMKHIRQVGINPDDFYESPEKTFNKFKQQHEQLAISISNIVNITQLFQAIKWIKGTYILYA